MIKKCCDGFRWTAQGLSRTYMHPFSPNPRLPSRLPQNIELYGVALHRRSLLVIHFKYSSVFAWWLKR